MMAGLKGRARTGLLLVLALFGLRAAACRAPPIESVSFCHEAAQQHCRVTSAPPITTPSWHAQVQAQAAATTGPAAAPVSSCATAPPVHPSIAARKTQLNSSLSKE